MYDLLIKNGLLADGVSDKTYRADIAIEGDKIAAIAENIDPERAKKTIDAKGQIVAPGFVDVHSHSDYYLLIDNRAESKLMQGVTTEVGGNCGYAAAPMAGEVLTNRTKDYEEQFGLKVTWSGLDQYFATLAKKKPGVNFAALLGYNTVRGSVIGFEDREPTQKEMGNIKAMVADGLDHGAVGMSVGVVYPPACFAKIDEFTKAFGVVAKRDKVFTTHIRSEGAKLIEALEEVTKVAKGSGAKLQVSHLKTAGKDNWSKLDKAFEILEKAADDGITLMADRYPYLASNTGLQVVLPDRAFDGGRDQLLQKLANKQERKKFREEILENHPEQEYWETVMVSQVVTDKNRDVEGLTVTEGAQKRGKDPFNFIFDLLIDEKANVEAIYFCMSQENMDRILAKPWVVVGSDSGARNIDGPLAQGRPHPRTFGSFPKFFAEYVTRKKVFTIPEAIRKMSTAGCEFFKIANRGKLKPGYFADIVIFDPEQFDDTSTYKEPLSYPVGLSHVFVNGVHAVKNGRPCDAGAGRAILVS